MKRFRNILVIFDTAIGGNDALAQASALARENNARLTIAKLLPDHQLSLQMLSDSEKLLQHLAVSVRHANVSEVLTKVLTGIAFVQIIRQVIVAQHDLVVIAAEAGIVLKEVFFGSTATHLMRKCPCPVWVVKPGQSVPYGKILAAVDPQPMSDNRLNKKIMDLATSLASRDHAALHIVHAWDVDGADIDTVRSELTAGQRKTILERHLHKHQVALNDLLAGYRMADINYHVHLPRLRPEQAISTFANKEQIDLIVMGTVARTGIPGFFIGNAAESVMSSVKSSMMAVKPDGFETPVTLPEDLTIGSQSPERPSEKIRRVA